MHASRPFGVAIAIVVGFCAAPARARIDWSNITNVNAWFQNGANWVGGVAPGAAATARFSLNNTYQVWWDSTTPVQTPSVKFLKMPIGNVEFVNQDAGPQYELIVNGSGGVGAQSDLSISNPATVLTLRGVHLHSLGGAELLSKATVTLDGSHPAGAKLTVDGGAGLRISGDLSVVAGGIFNSSSTVFVGNFGSGSAGISGAGSRWNSNLLYVGGTGGNGALNIAAGGIVTIGSSASIVVSPGSTGTATVTGTGSQWNVADELWVGPVGAGTLIVRDNGLVSASDLSIGSFGRLTGDGTIVANVTSDGTIAPGNSPGTLHIDGNYTQAAAGKLEIELASAASFDRLDISGAAALNGSLDVALYNGFQPHTGDFFADIYSAGSVTGAFGSVTGTNLGGGLLLNPISAASSLSLLAALPGDANLNRTADFTDLGILLNNYNSTGFSGIAQWNAGDFNDDHAVNFTDLGILLNNYNQHAPLAAANASVPEPSTLLLAVVALCGVGYARRHRLFRAIIAN